MKKELLQDETRAYVKIALAFVLAGAALITPVGFKDALVSYLNKRLGLELSFDVPWWVGLFLMIGGAIVYFMGEAGKQRAEKAANMAPMRTFVAVRHQSFEPLASRLPNDAVPARLGRCRVRHLECDQSPFLSGGVQDPVGALHQQTRLIADLVAERRTEPEATIGYYGIVHVPLQFLAGCGVSTWPNVILFELDRTTSCWYRANASCQ